MAEAMEIWMAREKAGRPGRLCGWDGRGFAQPTETRRLAVSTKIK
jgi:hypothetical protein